MNEIGIDRLEIVAVIERIDQLVAHANERSGAARREIEPAQQLLPAGLGCGMNFGGGLVRRRGLPGGNGGVEPRAVRAEAVRQRLEEGDARPGGQLVVFVEDLLGQRHARRFATAGQQLFAQFRKAFRMRRRIAAAVARAIEQRPAALGNAVQHLAEEGRVHGRSVPQGPNLRFYRKC